MKDNNKQKGMNKMPKDWQAIDVSDLFFIETGTTPSTKEKKYWNNGNIIWITPADLSLLNNTIFIKDSKRKITKKGLEETNLTLLPKGSIIISTRAPVGYVAIIEYPATFNQGCKGLIPKEIKNISTKFYYYYLLNKRYKLQNLSAGSTFSELSKSLLESFKMPYFNIKEQQKIAEILSTADEGIQKVDEVIRRTERLKKGLMQNLLTKGIGHKEFKDTQLGRVPREWQILRINDIGRVITGKTPSTSKEIYWNGVIPFITPEDINKNKFIYITKRYVTMNGAKQVGNILPKNTIIVVCIGSTIGKVALTSKNSISNQQINAILIKNNIDYNYIYYYLYKRSDFLKNFSGIAAVPIIKKSLFEKIEIALPNKLKEQQKIAEILSTVDKKIELQRKRKEKLERIKKSLMNDLLSGKKRVRIN